MLHSQYHLGHLEILGVVDIEPLDVVNDCEVGIVADAAASLSPQLAREDEKGTGLCDLMNHSTPGLPSHVFTHTELVES